MKKFAYSLIAIIAVLAIGESTASASTMSFDLALSNSGNASTVALTGSASPQPGTPTPYLVQGSGSYAVTGSGTRIGTAAFTYTVPSIPSVEASLASTSYLYEALAASTLADDDVAYLGANPVSAASGILIEFTSGLYDGDYAWINSSPTGYVYANYYWSDGSRIGADGYDTSDAMTPEASPLVLLGSGLLGVALLLFRRKRGAQGQGGLIA